MKTPGRFRGISTAILILLGGVATATPSQRVQITERLLGADSNGYGVLRAEYDNCGSYYKTITKLYFVERSADESSEGKSTLLSETESLVDPDHNDPKTPPAVTEKVLQRDDSLSLTEALLRYPAHEATAWTADQLKRLHFNPTAGISLDKRVAMVSGKQLAALFDAPEASDDLKITGAFEQGRCVFLTLSLDQEEGGPHTRVVGLSADLSDQIDAHLKREDIYLCAGTFDTVEGALELVESWRAAGKKQSVAMEWEIWSRNLPTDKTDHVLVLTRTKEMLEGWSKRIEDQTGIRFEAVSSDRFVKRTRVPRY